LLDIMMPKMDGNEVRRRLLKDPRTKDIPIVHLSAVGDFQKQAQALDEGVVDYITKPFSPNDLRLKVMEVLNPSQSDQVKREHDRKAGQTRAIADIMRRKSEDG
jgi:phosphoserine phosphatase RsbU/P